MKYHVAQCRGSVCGKAAGKIVAAMQRQKRGGGEIKSTLRKRRGYRAGMLARGGIITRLKCAAQHRGNVAAAYQ